MPHKSARLMMAALCCFGLIGCGSDSEGGPNILDAAAIYEANNEAFSLIRKTYPGPFAEFGRVPARRPSDETQEDKIFIKQLRKSITVEFIDFFPLGNTGKDEIDVVLERYDHGNRWTVVSLVYSEMPLPPADDRLNIAVFDVCDQRALEWFEMDHDGEAQSVSAFCRINQYWYAHQIVH